MKRLLFVWLDSDHTAAYCDPDGACPDGMALAVKTIADAVTFLKQYGNFTIEEAAAEIENQIFDDSRFVITDKNKIKKYYDLSYWREEINVLEDGYVPFRIMDGFEEGDGWPERRINRDDDENQVRVLPQWLHETLSWTECLGIRDRIRKLKGRLYSDPLYPGMIIHA